jgi:hypothetical protein
MRRFALLLAALLGLVCGTARARRLHPARPAGGQRRLRHSLTARYPAGGTPQARRQAEQAASVAMRKQSTAPR